MIGSNSNGFSFRYVNCNTIILGMIIRKLWPTIAESLEKPLTRLSIVMLVLLVAGFQFIKGAQIGDLLSLLFLSLAAAGVALASGITATPDSGIMRALGFTTSIRNVTVAILLATTCFPEPETLLAVLIYGLSMYVVCFPVAFVIARKEKKRESSFFQKNKYGHIETNCFYNNIINR